MIKCHSNYQGKRSILLYLRKHVVRQHAARTGEKRVVLLDRLSPRAFDLFLRIPSAAAAAAHISPTPPSPTPPSRPQRQSESSRNRLSLTNSSERSIFDFGRCLRWVGAPSHNLLLFRARRRLPFDISNDREGGGKRINIRLLRGSVRVRIFETSSSLSLLPRPTRSSIPSYSLNQTKNVSDFPYLPPKNQCRFCPLGIGMRREIDERIPSRYH